MNLDRRGFLIASAATLTTSLAWAADLRMAERSVGAPGARLVVDEWFSFSCHYCANFKASVFPEIKAKLIDTGKLRLVFHEYPRDQADLIAAMVARSLPGNRYEPFMDSLLATQRHWAFDRSVDPSQALEKMAALAGMSQGAYERVVSDTTLKGEILSAQAAVEQTYQINATPTFIFGNHAYTGDQGVSYSAFAAMVGG